jgi:hypothetical protein
MEQFKILHFLRDNPNTAFPAYEEVGEDIRLSLRRSLAHRLGLAEDVNPTLLLAEISGRGHPIGHIPPDDPFDIAGLLATHHRHAFNDLYVNWDRFDHIDKLSCTDLSRHFSDIWYPSADDIEIFDESGQWVLMVCHDGVVSLA